MQYCGNGSWKWFLDSWKFFTGEKYTILEHGYAVYLLKDADSSDPKFQEWMKENGDYISADTFPGGASDLRSQGGLFITVDPVLVALAIESWWSRNGEPQPQDVQLPIPTAFEAVEIVRNRRIQNRFNRSHKGRVPGLAYMRSRRISTNRKKP